MMKNYNYDYIVIIHHDEECEEQDEDCWHDELDVITGHAPFLLKRLFAYTR